MKSTRETMKPARPADFFRAARRARGACTRLVAPRAMTMRVRRSWRLVLAW